MPTALEQALRHFYDWERRGRGWDVYPYPVTLEPPFRPFLYHDTKPVRATDDGRRETVLSRWLDGLLGRVAPGDIAIEDWEEEEKPLLVPYLPSADPVTEVGILLGPVSKFDSGRASHFLGALAAVGVPVSFEIIASAHSIDIQVACSKDAASMAAAQLLAVSNDQSYQIREGHLETIWEGAGPSRLVFELGLEREFMLPIQGLSDASSDPLTSLLASFGNLRESELIVLQMLCHHTESDWTSSILRSVTDNTGDSFFNDSMFSAQVRLKVRSAIHACVARVAVSAESASRVRGLAASTLTSLNSVSAPLGNRLIALSNDQYPEVEHVRDFLNRRSRRSGMLLNSDELAALVHLPTSVNVEGVKRSSRRTKTASAVPMSRQVSLGHNIHLGQARQVGMSEEQRLRHTYVVGASGSGKSTLLLNLILEDIYAGRGVAVVDPHGDLIDEIVCRIPKNRVSDVVLFDPADAEYPVPFNILHAQTDLEAQVLSSDLVSIFRRFSTTWGDQMTSVLGNAVNAFLEHPEGGTLLDLRRFLTDSQFRSAFLEQVGDPEIVYYWKNLYPRLHGHPETSILTRLDSFIRSRLIREIVSQKQSGLDVQSVLDSNGVLLCKLSQGLIGEENAQLLGSLVLAKLGQVAIGRQAQHATERQPFFVYLDEFHHFAGPSLATLLSAVRKYGIGLVLAHQNLEQLYSRNRELAEAVLVNASTRVLFRLGESDARRLTEGLSYFEPRDVLALGLGEAICRLETSDNDFNVRTVLPTEVEPDAAAKIRESVVATSRARHGVRRKPPEEPKEARAAAPRIPNQAVAERILVPGRPDVSRKEVSIRQATSGRGKAQHQYLQSMVKAIAQDRGFRAVVEQGVHNGHGYVDVALEGASTRVACEISVDNDLEYEVQNVVKCLAAGFDHVLLLCSNERKRKAAEKLLASEVDQTDQGRVRCMLFDDLPVFLDGIPIAHATVRGYKVKVRKPVVLNEKDNESRKKMVGQVIARSLKRFKGS